MPADTVLMHVIIRLLVMSLLFVLMFSSEYLRLSEKNSFILYRSIHLPKHLADAKPEYSGPALTDEQQDFLADAGKKYRKLVKNDRPPRFLGKDAAAFAKWVTSRLEYPASSERDGQARTVKVKFTVDRDGSVSGVEVVESPGDAFSEEAVRVVSSSPVWSPGIRKGEKVRATYILPVVFR